MAGLDQLEEVGDSQRCGAAVQFELEVALGRFDEDMRVGRDAIGGPCNSAGEAENQGQEEFFHGFTGSLEIGSDGKIPEPNP